MDRYAATKVEQLTEEMRMLLFAHQPNHKITDFVVTLQKRERIHS